MPLVLDKASTEDPTQNSLKDKEKESSRRNKGKHSPNVRSTQGSHEVVNGSHERVSSDELLRSTSTTMSRDKIAQELERRYPMQTPTKVSSPTNVETAKEKTGKRAHKPSTKAKQPVVSKQLIQISCDEAGRVNRPICDEPFYHGFMTRDEAAGLLHKNGEFLVRKTEIGPQIHYVLSAMHKSEPHHILVKRTRKKRLFWVNRFAFKTVGDLILYHNRNRVPVFDDILIVKPVFKQDWQLNHEQVELAKELGSGQFGNVFQGWLQVSPFRSRVQVAVKTLHEQHMNADDRIKFLKEANLMLKLNHPNVVKFYGVAASREPIMIVMEFCPGESLEAVVTTRQTTSDEKLNFLYGAAKGLQYLHSEKIIHRDIAARNCLLDARGKVKISDFGLSVKGVEVKDQKGGRLPVKSMAPETLRRGLYSNASDVYSFGALMYEVYNNGKEPFGDCGLDGNQLRKAVIHQRVTLQIGDQCPPEMTQLFDLCRMYDPRGRPTFTDVIEHLSKQDGVEIELEPTFFDKAAGFFSGFVRKFK